MISLNTLSHIPLASDSGNDKTLATTTVDMVLNRCQTLVGFYNYSFPAQYVLQKFILVTLYCLEYQRQPPAATMLKETMKWGNKFESIEL